MNPLPLQELAGADGLLYVFGSCIVVVALFLVEIALLFLRERSIRGYLGCAGNARPSAD